MAITYIKRNFNFGGIVRIVTSDTTATALGANYITSQASAIATLNQSVGASKVFDWSANDLILLIASDGISICSINATFTTLGLITSQVGPYEINTATFSLTAAQFNGMDTTPVSVLAAQGAGTIIIPTLISMELIYGSAQFSGGGPVGFQYGNTAALGGTKATNTEVAADFTGATSNTVYNFVTATGTGSELPTSAAANAALYISNSSAAFTVGTGATFKGTIFYRVLPVI